MNRLLEPDQREEQRSFHTSVFRFQHLFERYRAGKLIPRDKSVANCIPLNPSAAIAALFYQNVLDIFPKESDPGYKPAEDFLPSDLLSCRLRERCNALARNLRSHTLIICFLSTFFTSIRSSHKKTFYMLIIHFLEVYFMFFFLIKTYDIFSGRF